MTDGFEFGILILYDTRHRFAPYHCTGCNARILEGNYHDGSFARFHDCCVLCGACIW